MDNYLIRKNYKYFDNIEQFSNDNLIKHVRLKFTNEKLNIIEIQLWIDSKNIFLDTQPEFNNKDYILNKISEPINLVDERKKKFSARESDDAHEIVFTSKEKFDLNKIEALVIYHDRGFGNLSDLDLEFLDEGKDIIYQSKEIIKDSKTAPKYLNYILKGPSYDNHPKSSQIIRRENSDIFNDSYISVANPKGSYFSYFNDIISKEEIPVEEIPVEEIPVEEEPVEEEIPAEEETVEEEPVEEIQVEETSEEILEDKSSEETLNIEAKEEEIIEEEKIKKDNNLMLISIAVIIVLFILFLLYFILK